jgi:glycosyltransferase involved in cell wall biosynthesis
MRVAVVLPFGSMGCFYRDRNYRYMLTWLAEHHPQWPVFTGTSDRDPFSPAQARNNGAALAGDWDVIVFWDADTLAHPDAVLEAVRRAAADPVMVIAGDSHIYTDQLSADRYLATGLMFPKPRGDATKPFGNQGIYRQPCSGILAVGRELWTATGGYIDSLGGEDSHEDLAFFQQCGIFGDGVEWVEGIQIHIWHPPARRSNGHNYRVWKKLAGMKRLGLVSQAREYLATLGHCVP